MIPEVADINYTYQLDKNGLYVMEWQQLIGFHYTAKLGSFTKAAHATFRTQSALSQQIKSLEQELDCLLIERIGKRNLRLTLAGERLFAFVDGLMNQHSELIEDINEVKGQGGGRLRIAAQFATFYYSLPKIVAAYIKQFPRVRLILLERSLHDLIPLVRSGEIDFGIFLERSVPKDITAIRWKESDVSLVTPLDHPLTREPNITLEMIARYPLILSPRHLKFNTRSFLENQFEIHGIKYHIAMEASTIELGSKYVAMGMGISIVPSGFGVHTLKQRGLALVPIKHLFESEYISIIMRKDKILQPHKRAFINLIFNSEQRPAED